MKIIIKSKNQDSLEKFELELYRREYMSGLSHDKTSYKFFNAPIAGTFIAQTHAVVVLGLYREAYGQHRSEVKILSSNGTQR
jgi:hypothetical protein